MTKCSLPWTKFNVYSNHLFSCCISDYGSSTMPFIGNISPLDLMSEGSLWNMWSSSPTYVLMRQRMQEGGFDLACRSIDYGESHHFRCSFPHFDVDMKGGFETRIQDENQKKAQESFLKGETVVSHFPLEIEMRLNTNCNLDCEMCSQKPWRGEEYSLSSLMLDDLLDFFRYARQVMITGGEPTISDLFPLVKDSIKEAKGAKIFLITNGHKLCESVLDGGYEDCFSLINVSLDAGDEETYNVVRKNGDWRTVNSQISDFMKRKLNSIHLFISCIVSGNNFQDLSSVVRNAYSIGVKHVTFSEVHSLDSVMDGEKLEKWRSHLLYPSMLENSLNQALSIGKDNGMRIDYSIPSISRFG